jgi:ubiquinone/menaquinone biosynthesis C-methylase UbiE
MRVVDLDRDMNDVIPTGATRDSQYLFDRMTAETLRLAGGGPGRRLLDVAAGFGQDAVALVETGADVVACEPSARMTGWAQLVASKREGRCPLWVRGWSDALPFRSDSFDAALCKGAIDHFDRPELAIAEMARVTRPNGRVVLAIANFESLACRVARAQDAVSEGMLRGLVRRGRRHYDVPADHFTRYDLRLMREQASRFVDLDVVRGISVGWGVPAWSRGVGKLPEMAARGALQALDAVARRAPEWADVIILAGRPRRSARTSR